MKQDTILLTFASPDQKKDFLKDTKIEASSIFLDEDLTLQIPVYFTAEAEESEHVQNVADGEPVEVDDEDFDLDEV